MKRLLYFLLLIVALLIPAGCSAKPALSEGAESHDRFARAEKYGQFIPANKSVDCKGTKVTIEKILMDKTSTFMIATVEGDIRGRTDSLNVDLYDDQDRKLGRSTFSQKLSDGKTLLTFAAVQSAPKALRMEFFGGPVGYGSGHVILNLDGITFKTVDKKLTGEYRLAETVEKKGYRLVVDSIKAGISETGVHYKLSSLGDYDGIDHGWLYDWYNNYSPEGEILSLSDSGRKLGVHLSSLNCLGPYYRVSQDNKTMVGRANFDWVGTNNLQVRLSNIYGYYSMNEIIPIEGVKDRMDIDKKLPVRNYTVHLKSFYRGDEKETWILDYSVLDSAGNKVDAAIEAGIYMKADNYRMPITLFKRFHDSAGGDRRLVFPWQPPESRDSLIDGPAVKITRLGIRQEDAVVDINLENPKKPAENRDETEIMAAVSDYYDTFGRALESSDVNVFEQKYGYLKPTEKGLDGVNDWRRHFQGWKPLGVKGYSVSFNDPIITVSENKATADIAGLEKIVRSGGDSAGGFSVLFYLEKADGKWRITKVDEITDAELHGVN
ncbi:MAG: hypothetical protein ACOY31_11305 [Bacillota bacterium]